METCGLDLKFIDQLVNIISKSETMEEFLIKTDLYGWDEEKRKNIYKFIVKAVISYKEKFTTSKHLKRIIM